jgi:predicted anti-sigma-YlaC factor YlaD
MPCNKMRGQLSLYGSGDLDAKDHAVMSEHLKDCPSCRDHASSFDQTRSLLSSYALKQSADPQGLNLWSGIQGRVNDGFTKRRPKG